MGIRKVLKVCLVDGVVLKEGERLSADESGEYYMVPKAIFEDLMRESGESAGEAVLFRMEGDMPDYFPQSLEFHGVTYYLNKDMVVQEGQIAFVRYLTLENEFEGVIDEVKQPPDLE